VETIRQLRKAAGFTQAELASAAGIRQATLSSLENGQSGARKATVMALSQALKISTEQVSTALRLGKATTERQSWGFLKGLDRDLAEGLSRELCSVWTHTSTALEGNTISAGDTLFVLTEGLTISGKSLREHQEIHGHAEAIHLVQNWLHRGDTVRIRELHSLHRCVMSGAPLNPLAPIGEWKIEQNGTTALTSAGQSRWHDYADPHQVSGLVEAWLDLLAEASGKAPIRSRNELEKRLAKAYTDLHLGFTAIHPYADGNGRMARLLANLPLLKAGWPPLLIAVEERRNYLQKIGDYSLARGKPVSSEPLIRQGAERDALAQFFLEQWRMSLDQVAEYQARQKARR